MIYLSNEPYPQEISVPRSFGVIVPQRNTYLSTADIAADLETDSNQKVLAASQGVVLKEMVDAKADASDVYTKQEVDTALAEKASVTDIPTKTSDLQNDSGFVTGQEVSQTYETKSDATAKETALQNAINAKQDTLTVGTGITIEGNVISATGGGGTPEIFWAEYGVTTYNEIATAVSEGKMVFTPFRSRIFTLAGIHASRYLFYEVTGSVIYTISVGTDNGWLQNNTPYENSANRVSDILTNRTSTSKYPNTKAVYDALGKYGVISQTQTWTGSASTGYTYTMSDQVWGLIPQANIDLYESAGAVFNETTGYFELNGLVDISYEEMQKIYSFTISLRGGRGRVLSYALSSLPVRTSLPIRRPNNVIGVSFDGLLYPSAYPKAIESVAFEQGDGDGINMGTTLKDAFRSSYLKEISPALNVAAVTDFTRAFADTCSLVSVFLKGLKASVSFENSLNLSAESIAYMVNNAGTATFTITLHATAYARAIADADVQAALAAHTNVTLASA